MFNVADIITNGSDLVGWRASANTDYTALPSTLTTSQSGYYVNDLPGVDMDIINDGLSGDKSSVAVYLQQVHESEIASLVNEFVTKARSKLGSKAILSNFDVANGIADMREFATKNARFVGWAINPRSSNNIKVEITKIGLQLDTAQTVKLYLYETSQRDAIKTVDLVYTNVLSVQWFSVTDFIANYRGTYGTRQQYLLGYYEYDPNNVQSGQLTGNAVEFDFDCGCKSAPRRVFGEYVWIQPIEIANTYLNTSGSDYLLPDIKEVNDYYCDESRGMFAKINVTCDVTDVIIDNIQSFAKALQYKIAIRVLDDYLASKRLNATTDGQRYRAVAEDKRNMYWSFLNGWIDNTGFRHRGIMEDIVIDFSQIDDVCLPCEADGLRIVQMGRR